MTLVHEALKASIHFANEVMCLIEMSGDRLEMSEVNRAVTITNLKQDLGSMARLVEALNAGRTPRPSASRPKAGR